MDEHQLDDWKFRISAGVGEFKLSVIAEVLIEILKLLIAWRGDASRVWDKPSNKVKGYKK